MGRIISESRNSTKNAVLLFLQWHHVTSGRAADQETQSESQDQATIFLPIENGQKIPCISHLVLTQLVFIGIPFDTERNFHFIDGLAEAQDGWPSCFDVAPILELQDSTSWPQCSLPASLSVWQLTQKHCKNCSNGFKSISFPPSMSPTLWRQNSLDFLAFEYGDFPKENQAKPALGQEERALSFALFPAYFVLLFMHSSCIPTRNREDKELVPENGSFALGTWHQCPPSCVYYSLRNMAHDFS